MAPRGSSLLEADYGCGGCRKDMQALVGKALTSSVIREWGHVYKYPALPLTSLVAHQCTFDLR
jgi:hypothetical protein